MTKDNKKIIPIFFASDDNYIPFLSVAIKSLLDNSSNDYFYDIHILTEGIAHENVLKLKMLAGENSEIIIDDIMAEIASIKSNMDATLRDYYTTSIFYRIFIARLFKQYDRAIYLDCDICVVDDISKMFFSEIGENILGVVTDGIVENVKELQPYVENAVGVDANKYFNSGVLLINLKKYREENIEQKFIDLMVKYNFATIAPDQDYLNVLCKNKVFYLEEGWDKMSLNENLDGELHLVHYNMFKKPWLFDDVPYQRYFWDYAKGTPFYKPILTIKENAPLNLQEKGEEGLKRMIENSRKIIDEEINFKKILGQTGWGE